MDASSDPLPEGLIERIQATVREEIAKVQAEREQKEEK